MILLINSFLFLLTFAIYTAFPKLLSTSYSRLMRHFVVAMFAAFLVLSINQFVSFRDTPVLCQLSGDFMATLTLIQPSNNQFHFVSFT